MNQYAVVKIQHEVNGRSYYLELPVGAPFGEAFDAAQALSKAVLEMAQRAQQQPVETANAELVDKPQA